MIKIRLVTHCFVRKKDKIRIIRGFYFYNTDEESYYTEHT